MFIDVYWSTYLFGRIFVDQVTTICEILVIFFFFESLCFFRWLCRGSLYVNSVYANIKLECYCFVSFSFYMNDELNQMKENLPMEKCLTHHENVIHHFGFVLVIIKVLWKWRCSTLKWAVWYFEEGGVVLWRGWCGTLKMVVDTLKWAVWYFEEGGVVLWKGWLILCKGWCGTLIRVMW